MMERLTRILGQNGWDTLLVNTRSEDDAAAALRAAGQRRVDAAVLIGSNFNDAGLQAALGARRVGKLVVFARYSHNPGTLSICVDDEAAMTKICDHVLERGYKKPFFLAGPQTESAHVSRKETFLARWSAARDERPDFAAVDVYDPLLAFDLVSSRFLNHASPDVIVCENDALAMGAIDAIRHVLKRRVPEDIAVTGFDDVPQASNPNYRLTTFRQPISAMAEAVVALLKGEDPDRPLSSFEGTLIVRESA
jgi:DNA-binding LacI/PurR family transcriptional regulator